MSGAPGPLRYATFVELLLSGDWSSSGFTDDGFEGWYLADDQGQDSSLTITRSDGKVLSFPVTTSVSRIEIQNNLIRWTPGSEGPFQ
jgi:hypothetical protein